MKHYILAGFAATIALNGENLTVTVNSKEVKLNKKKVYSLICTDESGKTEDFAPVIGTAYDFPAKDLIAEGEGKWVSDEQTVPKPVAAPVDPVAVEKKRLKGLVDTAQKYMLSVITDPSKVMAAATSLAEAKKTYEDYLSANGGTIKAAPKVEAPKSQAEVDSLAAITVQLAKIASINDSLKVENESLTKLIATHKEAGFVYGKVKTGNKGGGGTRVLDYDKAQAIRKEIADMIATGKSESDAVGDVVKTSGLERVMIVRLVKYRQHLLKQGDPQYLPFDQAYYNRYEGQTLADVSCADQKSWYSKK